MTYKWIDKDTIGRVDLRCAADRGKKTKNYATKMCGSATKMC